MKHVVDNEILPKDLLFKELNSSGKNFWPYAIDLAKNHYNTESSSYRRKFYIRCLAHQNAMQTMMAALNFTGMPEKMIAAVVSKVRKGYLYKGASTDQCCRLISQNYLKLKEILSEKSLLSFLSGQPIFLCKFSVENDVSPLSAFLLTSLHGCVQEGELMVEIRHGNGSLVYRMAFTLANIATVPSMIIGCTQGGPPGNDVCLVDGRSLTRKYYGVRPKAMVLPVLQILAQWWGCKAVFGVTNDFQYYQTTNRRKNNVSFDYNTFWKEQGAVYFSSVFMKIPVEPERKPLEDIATKKRGMYRKRYVLFDDIAKEIQYNLLSC